MAIGPTPPLVRTPLPTPGKRSQADATPAAAAASEREASRRIRRAEEAVTEAQLDANQQIDRVRDGYERQYSVESARNEESLENQRNKGYEALRDLKRNQSEQLRNTRKEGERSLNQLQSHYRDSLYQTERRGQEQYQELRSQQDRNERYERHAAQEAVEKLHTEGQIQQKRVREDGEQKIGALQTRYKTEVDRMAETTAAAGESMEQKFLARYRESLDQGQSLLNEVVNRSAEQLENMKADMASKLAAYGSRNHDPFYRLMDIGARLSDHGDEYVVRATIPEHEQEHVSVSMKGDNLVISGYRSNQEKLKLPSGQLKTTASNQAFSESIPLSHPVDPKALTKEFHGSTLVITVPKKGPWARREDHHKNEIEKPRISRPQFPENIGKLLKDPEPRALDEDKPLPAPRTRSSGTLSRG